MEQYYLGFDAGTQSVKTAVYDIDMNLIVQDTNATILNYPHPGWVEMDADQYLHATVTGIRNCVTKMKEKNLDPDNIRSILVQKLGDRTNQNSQTSELILEHRTGHPTC